MAVNTNPVCLLKMWESVRNRQGEHVPVQEMPKQSFPQKNWLDMTLSGRDLFISWKNLEIQNDLVLW